MDDLDQKLAALATMPVPARLAAIDGKVFTGIHRLEHADRRTPARIACVAAVAASLLGVATAGVPIAGSAPASAAPLGGATLAPSELLAADR